MTLVAVAEPTVKAWVGIALVLAGAAWYLWGPIR